MSDQTTAILIPARLESTRLPNKMAIGLNGVPLVRYVLEKCKSFGYPSFVLTDSRKLATLVRNDVVLTDHAENGTERCMQVLDELGFDQYINVQGDMPDVTKEIVQAVERQLDHDIVATAYTEMKDIDRRDPSVVKMIHSRGRPHWFCRASLSYGDRHIGVYGYRQTAKELYRKTYAMREERLEKLEQLRWIQNGIDMGITKVEFDGIEINTKEDLELWHKRNPTS